MNQLDFSSTYQEFRGNVKSTSGALQGMWEGNGWHFYSMLKIRWDKMTAENRSDVKRMVSVYTNYNRSAVAAAEIIAYRNRIKCEVLEHQGNVIHFFFPDMGPKYAFVVHEFGKILNHLVEVHVRKYYDDAVTQFHMASQFGRSVLLRVQSIEPSDSADSTVSLGPCANSPAKQMGESCEGNPRPLWWRLNDEARWECENCSDFVDVESSWFKTMLSDRFGAHFFNGQPVASCDAMSLCSLKSATNVPESTTKNLQPIQGFFFRADMDGFTNKIKSAFEHGRIAIKKVVDEFVGYMKKANNWEGASDMAVSAFPWAGDCFNALVLPADAGRGWPGGFDMSRKAQPLAIVTEWEDSVSTRWNDSNWAYTVSGGDVYKFNVRTRDRTFKLAVGRPTGLTMAAIHFTNIDPGAVVMHKDDVEALVDSMRKKFVDFDHGRHPNFKWLSQEERKCIKKRAISEVASMADACDGYQKSKPWYS